MRVYPHYTTVLLRGEECDIGYRIVSEGPGWGWDVDWGFTDQDCNLFGADLTPEEEDLINKAINEAEGHPI